MTPDHNQGTTKPGNAGRLRLPLSLPEGQTECESCIERLKDLLESKEGVDQAHLVQVEPGKDGLCVHFDPDVVSVGRVRELVQRSGAELARRFGHLLLEAQTTTPRRARRLSGRIHRLPGVLDAEFSAEGAVRVEFDREVTTEEQLQGALRTSGVRIRKPVVPAPPDHSEAEASFFERAELAASISCGILVGLGWLASAVSGIPSWVSPTFFVLALVVGGAFTAHDVWGTLRQRRFEIDFLMFAAAVGAAAIGEFADGALLLFLFNLGHSLEKYAMGRAKQAIQALGEFTPKTASVRRSNQVQQIPVEDLSIGDTVIVKPNERIPADGFVTKGESSVDQSPVTGESMPIDKKAVGDVEKAMSGLDRLGPEYRVFAGTLNGSGMLEILATKRSADTTLARVVRMVSEAETQKSPTQQFTDKFERVFVPGVLILATLLAFAWLAVDEPWSASLYRALAVLVAASPCALAIATPSAVLSAVARAGRGGVLVKGGRPLENLGRLRAIAFDKTGTLTEGRPKLVDVLPREGVNESDLLSVAVAVEQLSDHPLAAAVVSGGLERLGLRAVTSASEVRSITGRGVQGVVEGRTVYIGKKELFSEVEGSPPPLDVAEAVLRLEEQGRTTMLVRDGDSYLGVLGLMDSPRPEAAAVVANLRKIGIERMLMISGDNQRVAQAVASQVGLDEARGDLMPDDKVTTIKSLRQEGGVGMVGDGVNDAPAMANATVGIAMGAAGSDVALETADIALMADDLRRLPFAVGLSRSTSRVIRQNLWFSLGMVAFLVPATILGLGIGPAVALHEGSTLIVVLNALRLLAYREPAAS